MSLDDLFARAEAWARDDPDPGTAAELRGLVASRAAAELKDAFAGRLQFGTAGLRGIIGPGPNRMNRWTLGASVQGHCEFLRERFPGMERLKVVPSHWAVSKVSLKNAPPSPPTGAVLPGTTSLPTKAGSK